MWQQQYNYFLQSVVLHFRRSQINALAAISLLLLLAGQLFDIAAMAEAAHRACEPFLQSVSRAFGSWGVAMKGSEWSLGLQRRHWVCLPIWTSDCVVLCKARVREKKIMSKHMTIYHIYHGNHQKPCNDMQARERHYLYDIWYNISYCIFDWSRMQLMIMKQRQQLSIDEEYKK